MQARTNSAIVGANCHWRFVAVCCALAIFAATTGAIEARDARQADLIPQFQPEDVPAPPGATEENQEELDAEPSVPDAACGPVDGPMFESQGPTWQEDEPGWIGGDSSGSRRRGGWFRHCFLHILPPSNGRYRDIGRPLVNDSWLNRPYSIGVLTGGLLADNPIPNRVDGTSGYLVGVRLGWDVEYFWGIETRFASSYVGLRQDQNTMSLGRMGTFLWDTNLLYYPLGDTQWRPFALIGLGMADYRFLDEFQNRIHDTTFMVPFGAGLKYRHNSAWAFRFDVIDNFSLSSAAGVGAMNNISITAGVEAHFGMGPRRSYWPWNPTRSFR
jgi:hypothetical protein